MPALCRDCLKAIPAGPRCPECRSRRVLAHDELWDLTIAHVDCDAFYASVEKHDNPALRDQPVIVGGGTRGVVSTCCYIARMSGVRSAMPMFEARRRCPAAVVIAPRMARYAEVSAAIRDRMLTLTPLVEPLSLDEAFLDLTGTARLHGTPPAVQLARLAQQVERELGVTLSVGLSHNKFLAKIASDQDKPRGFAVIGRGDTAAFLADQPVGILWGVGVATRAALEAAGIRTLADLRQWAVVDLVARFGQTGARLHELAHGRDHRRISADEAPKSLSNETTFATDITDVRQLQGQLWHLVEQVAGRAKAAGLEGRTVTVKVKRADHRILTRRQTMVEPAQIADALWRVAQPLLAGLMDQAPFRLLGVGLADLSPASGRDPAGDLLDPQAGRRAAAERAVDAIRARFGAGAIAKGRGWPEG